MARSIRGWIINLLDGLGPPPSSVHVRATVQSTNTPLDLEDHGLGRLDEVHVIGGSVSPEFADNTGHFGWDMELSPGLIDVLVNPTDPQNEYRRRFPDESAQMGKAFLTDLERVGWSGGRSGIVWAAVPHGTIRPPGGALANPYNTGNAAVLQFGVGADAGRWLCSRFIAILGGVPFTVEMSDILVPVVGSPAAPPNESGGPRWDLYCLCMNDDPSSLEYGKQYFEQTRGVPGGGIPPMAPGTSTLRRIPLQALRMPAFSSVYDSAYDVRQWLHPPGGTHQGNVTDTHATSTEQTISTSPFASILNTDMAHPLLSPQEGYCGFIEYSAHFRVMEAAILSVSSSFQGVNPDNGAPIGPNYCADQGEVYLHRQAGSNLPTANQLGNYNASAIIPIRHIGGFSSNPTGEVRTWAEFKTSFTLLGAQLGTEAAVLNHQRATLILFADSFDN